MRYILALLLILTVLITGCAQTETSSDDVIKIGVSTALTGPVQMPGAWGLQGIELAVDEINANGGINGKLVEVIIEDDQCNSRGGIDAVNKLLNTDNVNKLFIFCTAAAAGTETLTIDRALVTYASVKFTENLNYVSMYPDLLVENEKLVSYIINEKNITRIAQIYQSDAAGKAIQEAFKEEFEKKGGTIVLSESFSNVDNADYRSILTKIKSENINAIMLTPAPANFINAIQQAKELDLDVQFFSNSFGAENPIVVSTLGELSEGVIYSSPYLIDTSSDFYVKFKEKYDSEPGVWSAFGYDAIIVLSQISDYCDNDYDCMVQNINTKEYEGSTGSFEILDSRSTNRDVYIKEIRNGNFELVR